MKIMVLDFIRSEGETKEAVGFDWKGAIADGIIVGGIAGFSSLTASTLIADPARGLLGAVIAFGVGFFTTLGAKRGLK